MSTTTPTIAPHNVEAEQALLGAILLDNTALAKALELVVEEDFYQTTHRKIYSAMRELADRGDVIDQITLTARLKGRSELESVGGAAYLAELLTTVATSVNIRHHASEVARTAQNRKIRHLSLRLAEEAGNEADQAKLDRLIADLSTTSIHVHKTDPLHESNFTPASAAQLLSEPPEEVDWVQEDYLPAGGFVLIAGKPKEGKTTLTYELAVKVTLGQPFLGRQTRKGAVLILALEEHAREVRMRLRNLGAADVDSLFVHVGPLAPTTMTLSHITRFAQEHGVVLIVVDTLSALWTIENENDAAEVTKAVKPLQALARTSGSCVLLIHHARKSEGSHGDEIRGSGALFAAVDIALILKRHTVQTQRLLQAQSRFPETPAELVLELRETGYVALGDPASTGKAARLARLAEALPNEWIATEKLATLASLPLRDTSNLIKILVREGKAEQRGKGVRNDPHQFRRNSILALKSDPSPESNPNLFPANQEVRLDSIPATPPVYGTRNEYQKSGFDSGDPLPPRQNRNGDLSPREEVLADEN